MEKSKPEVNFACIYKIKKINENNSWAPSMNTVVHWQCPINWLYNFNEGSLLNCKYHLFAVYRYMRNNKRVETLIAIVVYTVNPTFMDSFKFLHFLKSIMWVNVAKTFKVVKPFVAASGHRVITPWAQNVYFNLFL